MHTEYKGECLCGNVSFSVRSFSEQAANCHCTMCRKFHGAAFGTLVAVAGFKWTSGSKFLKEYVASNGTTRTFCSNCGSSLSFRSKGADPKEIEIAIALFNEDIPVTVDAQIYTKYKTNWCALQKDLPTFAEGREE